MQGATFNLRATAVLVAEATSMRNQIKAIVQAGFTNAHIEGDNNILIRAMKG